MLLPERAIYWPDQQALLLADLHLGKAGHFRRKGIQVPRGVAADNFERLNQLLNKYPVGRVVILGDMFHSEPNQEWREFWNWKRKRLDSVGTKVSLVKGNHDWAACYFSDSNEIEVQQELIMPPFRFIHNIDDVSHNNGTESTSESTIYTLGGHVHPAVKLTGKGRQQLKLPCFYFGRHHGLLPAFGSFTGTHVLKPHSEDKVFVVLENQVEEVS